VSPVLVLFDLDGTLVDSLPDIAGALNHALAESGRAPLALDVVQTLVGEGVLRLAEKALASAPGAAGGDAAALAERIRVRYRERPCVHSRLYPGIEGALDGLRADAARRLAVLTNKPGDVARALLAELGVAARFDAIIGDGDGHPRKPDPAAARSLMARFGAAPERTLLVGDGVPDMLVAAAAGCPAAAALWGYTPRALLLAHHPAHSLEQPVDLLALASSDAGPG
jgi:phosphoglycolate phosphatase